MKILTLLFIVLFGQAVMAMDAWLCTEAASQRHGDDIYSCGVATGEDENSARMAALDNAKEEFNKICNASSDCKYHQIVLEPKRTTCGKDEKGFKCYRLIIFSIKNKMKKDVKIVQSYSDIEDLPKVRVGMSKKELIEKFGIPVQVLKRNGYENAQIFLFQNERFCLESPGCYVGINNGKVTDFSYFKPAYTDYLN